MSDNTLKRDLDFQLQSGAKISPLDLGINISNGSGGAFAAGDVLCIQGWDETKKLYKAVKADADQFGAPGQYYCPRVIANGASGVVHKEGRLGSVDTSGGAVSDPVYLSETAGGWTLTAPSSPNDAQIIGWVAVVHASTGVVQFNLTDAIMKRIAIASLSSSLSPSASGSLSPSASISLSPSLSISLSPSVSPSASVSESASVSLSPSASGSASISLSPSASTSLSPSASNSPSGSISLSPSLSPSPS